MTRSIVLAVALLFVLGLGVLTLYAAAEQGVTLGTLVSFAVLVLLGVGVIGALRNPPG
ncbi:MAG TPA: hypothetical protein VMB91_10595 [Solirubrobacteraceae bacterium]|nr:hypothetical protein [Solirubrobacteraceae bacterium]